jgi:Do/DeqQ family serine protease
MTSVNRCWALVLASTFVSSVFAAEAAKKQPKLSIDSSPVTEGKTVGLVTYADVIAPVQKAVVSVYSTKTVRRTPHPFFPMFGDPEREAKEKGLGSGVIVSSDGYILTNNHVVEGADELNVQLTDGREMKAKVIGADPKTDVAVIKLDSEGLPSVVLADSDKSRVGDIVFAVGNPLGVGQTVTMGIISATSREVGILDEVQGYESFIQTDAAINQGNSGGALIDAKGRLVGINSAILSTTRGNIGIGFAIPVNLAASIMHSLIETGSVMRGFLGVQVDVLSPEVAETLKLERDTRGVIVNAVTEGGPAEKAGVKPSDVIVSINDRSVSSRQELRLLVSQLRPDSEAKLKLMRDGKEKIVTVKLGKLADSGRDELIPGVTVNILTDEQRRALNIDPRISSGLVITEISKDSPYADRLLPNMVIIEINRVAVTDLESAIQLIRPGRNLFLVLVRGTPRYVPVLVK